MKSTKKSLLASGLALLASVALLAGTTFAWFTDSVTNSGNKIQAGSLKVDLLQLSDTLNDGQKTALGDDLPADGVYVSIADVKAPIFDYDLWEPGYTDFVALEVSNTGSLALKWKLELTANGAAGILGDVIDVYAKVSDSAITKPETFAAIPVDGEYRLVGTLNELIADPDGAAYGVLYAAADADKPGASAMYAGIALHMRETAGNDYQGESIGATFDLVLNATQYTYEKDGFDNSDYDQMAFAAASLKRDVKNAAAGDTVLLTGDALLDETLVIDKGLTIDGQGHTLKADTKRPFQMNPITVNESMEEVTIRNCVIESATGLNALILNGVTMENCVFKNCGVYITPSPLYGRDFVMTGCSFEDGATLTMDMMYAGDTYFDKYAPIQMSVTLRNNTFHVTQSYDAQTGEGAGITMFIPGVSTFFSVEGLVDKRSQVDFVIEDNQFINDCGSDEYCAYQIVAFRPGWPTKWDGAGILTKDSVIPEFSDNTFDEGAMYYYGNYKASKEESNEMFPGVFKN